MKEIETMGKVHAIVLLVIGITAMVISLAAFYALSGILATWLMMPNNSDSILGISSTTISFTCVLVVTIWPLIGYWIDAMFTAYGSADDE